MTKDENEKNVLHGAKTPDSEKSTGSLRRSKSFDIQVKPSDAPASPRDGVNVKPADTKDEKFRIFRERSYIDLLEKEKSQKTKDFDKKHKQKEVHLVDGELKFDEDDSSEGANTKPDEKLVEGNPLPDHLGKFPDKLLGQPIEEIDPNITSKVSL